LAAIPDEVVDDLIVHGSPEQCKATIQRYVDNGVTTPALMVLPLGRRRAQGAERPRSFALTGAPRGVGRGRRAGASGGGVDVRKALSDLAPSR